MNHPRHVDFITLAFTVSEMYCYVIRNLTLFMHISKCYDHGNVQIYVNFKLSKTKNYTRIRIFFIVMTFECMYEYVCPLLCQAQKLNALMDFEI